MAALTWPWSSPDGPVLTDLLDLEYLLDQRRRG
jgi:hypothetical protein